MLSRLNAKGTRTLIGMSLLLVVALASRAQSAAKPHPLTLDDLQRMSTDQLLELYKNTEFQEPFVGVGKGRLVNLTDKLLPRIKVRLANTMWRGKDAYNDGRFINRWIGGASWIEGGWTVGPSWVDGKPAMIMEYTLDTPLFGNLHDEFREVAPGLFMGPLYERYPCPKFRGFVAVKRA